MAEAFRIKSFPRVIRDPVHDIIPFHDLPEDHLLLKLINTREFQRLRRIKQLGFGELVFPAANHSRLSHSIGVMHVARKLLEQLAPQIPGGLSQDTRAAVLAAALLHDIGHGPFSHAFESLTNEKHERRTQEIILDPDSEVSQSLREYDPQLPELLCAFYEDDPTFAQSERFNIPVYLTQIVSSQLDADRFDYLLRDSHATGTGYGRYDLGWIIHHILVNQDRDRLYLSRKATNAAEEYVYARYHMYQSVYFHKTTRSAEVMFRLLFERFKTILSEKENKAAQARIVTDAPETLLAVFSGQKISLSDYLSLDDFTITEFFKLCTTSSDAILQYLAVGILNRRLLKCVDFTGFEVKSAQFEREAQEAIKGMGHDPAYLFAPDTPADTPYKPYNPDRENNPFHGQIFVENSIGKQVELTQELDIQHLTKRITKLRYYFPNDCRDAVQVIAARIKG